MENASKALIISGGILIGIIIASLFAYEMFSISQTGNSYQAKINMEDVYEFNAQFTKYINKDLPAQDVVSILNFVLEWNQENEFNAIKIGQIKLSSNKNIMDAHKLSKAELNQELGGNMNTYILSNFGTKDYAYKLRITGYDEFGRVNNISILNTKYKELEYTVTLDANGGSVSTNTIIVKENTKIQSLLPNATRDGYDFQGWYTSPTEGSFIDSNYMITGNITLYAHWKVGEYTVTFDYNNESGKTEKKTATYDQVIQVPSNSPTWTGHDFQGWYTSKEGGDKVTDNYIVKGNTTLYAHWETKKYVLDINPDYNLYGTGYDYWGPIKGSKSRIESFNLRILDENGNEVYNKEGIDDFYDPEKKYSGYNYTYYITNIKYSDGYTYKDITLRNDGKVGNSNLLIEQQTSTSVTFKHDYDGDIWLSINTKPIHVLYDNGTYYASYTTKLQYPSINLNKPIYYETYKNKKCIHLTPYGHKLVQFNYQFTANDYKYIKADVIYIKNKTYGEVYSAEVNALKSIATDNGNAIFNNIVKTNVLISNSKLIDQNSWSTVTLDVSNLNGTLYVGLHGCDTDYYISKIWLTNHSS